MRVKGGTYTGEILPDIACCAGSHKNMYGEGSYKMD